MDTKDMQVGSIVALTGGSTKDDLAESFRKLNASLPTYLKHVELMAQLQRVKYLALIKQGFTEAQALELSRII